MLLPASLTTQHSSQSAYFDAEFRGYRSYSPEPWRWSFMRRIFGELDVSAANGPYLDIGVGGSGATVIEAARRGVASFGCDLSVEAVAQADRFAASEQQSANARFVACAAESLAFADGVFASLSAVAVLEHVERDDVAASEMFRVLRPGGRAWVTVPHAYRFIPPPVWPVYWAHDRRLGHQRHYDIRSLVAVMERAGFRHVSTSFTGHPVKIAQVLLDKLLRGDARTRVWWRLESLDLRAQGRALGALQLSAVFDRPA